MVDDNLNMIMTEVTGCLLNGSFQSDIIEGNYKKNKHAMLIVIKVGGKLMSFEY